MDEFLRIKRVLIGNVDLDTAGAAYFLGVDRNVLIDVVAKTTEDEIYNPEVLCINVGGYPLIEMHNFDGRKSVEKYITATVQTYFFSWFVQQKNIFYRVVGGSVLYEVEADRIQEIELGSYHEDDFCEEYPHNYIERCKECEYSSPEFRRAKLVSFINQLARGKDVNHSLFPGLVRQFEQLKAVESNQLELLHKIIALLRSYIY